MIVPARMKSAPFFATLSLLFTGVSAFATPPTISPAFQFQHLLLRRPYLVSNDKHDHEGVLLVNHLHVAASDIIIEEIVDCAAPPRRRRPMIHHKSIPTTSKATKNDGGA